MQNFTPPLPGNVLVVEDDDDCGMMIVTALSDAGYGVRLARTRNDAAVAIRRYLYEYIILDVRMPGMSITDFQAAVSLSAAKNARIILTTAESDAATEAQKYYIPNWLGKPFTPEELLQLMSRIKIFKPQLDSGVKI